MYGIARASSGFLEPPKLLLTILSQVYLSKQKAVMPYLVVFNSRGRQVFIEKKQKQMLARQSIKGKRVSGLRSDHIAIQAVRTGNRCSDCCRHSSKCIPKTISPPEPHTVSLCLLIYMSILIIEIANLKSDFKSQSKASSSPFSQN